MENKNSNFGLFTAISMIVGIVIGSGIFFKSSSILLSTGGSVGLGVLAFCIAAFGIIFGSITLIELSIRTDKNGGLIGYFEDFVSKKSAAAFGWFQTFVYLPTIGAVVAWVSGIYTCIVFGNYIENTLENQIMIAILYLIIFFLMNVFSTKLGALFQNLSTVIKLIPLIIIAFSGLLWGQPIPHIPDNFEVVKQSDVGLKWLSSLAPIAFSLDGWVIALSITNEVKNPRRTMPIAFTIAPLSCLAIYLFYFLGLNKMLGPEYIMSTKNVSVETAANLIFGPNGAKIITIFVLVSILGVLNGLVLGIIRMPQALASKNMIPMSYKISKIDPKLNLSRSSCIISLIALFFWLFIHYFVTKNDLLKNSDISEISIVFTYLCYSVLYIRVMKMRSENKIKSVFKGLIAPILAIIGSLIILVGSLYGNPKYALMFIVFCAIFSYIGFLYYSNHSIEKQK